MTATEIILTVFLAITCIIGGVLLYRLEHVTALNIDLRRENDALHKQIEDIKSLVEQEFNRLKAKRQ